MPLTQSSHQGSSLNLGGWHAWTAWKWHRVDDLGRTTGQTINRFLRGSVLHASRRADEMDAAAEYLKHLGMNPLMARSTAQHLRALQTQHAS